LSASRLRVRYGSLPVLDIDDLHVCPDAGGGGSWGLAPSTSRPTRPSSMSQR